MGTILKVLPEPRVRPEEARVRVVGWRRIVALSGAAVLLAACGGSAGGSEDDGTIDVVASFYPLAEAADRIGDDLATVTNLTPPGVEPHDFELAPDNVEAVANADVVLYLGGGFQPALEEALDEAEDAIVLDALDVVPTEPPPPEEAEEGVTVDPHVWLDPSRFATIAERVATTFGEADEANAETYSANANAYATELRELDDAFRTGLSDCKRSTMVTAHAAFGYLADAYGLTQIPIAGVSPESEPDAQHLAELRDVVVEQGVTTIFTEELVSPDVAESLAREAGVEVDVLSTIEGLTEEQMADGEDYASLMNANLQALRRALGCA
jgi:zinc transport system substrate-binding protein